MSDPWAVVLVEGASDENAVRTLARRRGRDLDGEGVAVVPMGGATNIATFVQRFGPRGLDVTLSGLCDVREEGSFRRGLERAGMGDVRSRDDMEALGFYVCVVDLEDELIRALGPPAVEEIIVAEGELGMWTTFQKQSAQRDRPVDAQLRRFLGTKSGRKVRYGRLLVDALDLARVPEPLDRVLGRVE